MDQENQRPQLPSRALLADAPNLTVHDFLLGSDEKYARLSLKKYQIFHLHYFLEVPWYYSLLDLIFILYIDGEID